MRAAAGMQGRRMDDVDLAVRKAVGADPGTPGSLALSMEPAVVGGPLSEDQFTLALGIERMLDIEIPDEDAAKFVTLQDAVDYVRNKGGVPASAQVGEPPMFGELVKAAYEKPDPSDVGLSLPNSGVVRRLADRLKYLAGGSYLIDHRRDGTPYEPGETVNFMAKPTEDEAYYFARDSRAGRQRWGKDKAERFYRMIETDVNWLLANYDENAKPKKNAKK